MTRLRCAVCGELITAATYDPAHVYRLPVYELVIWQGWPAALRIGWRRATVCAPCVERIHAAADRRAAAQRVMALPA